MTAWTRLQRISQIHALELWQAGQYGIGQYSRKTGGRCMYSVPEPIEENVKVLGSGDEERIKDRIHWYITYHPAIFDASRS